MGIPHFVRNDGYLGSTVRGLAAASPPPTPSPSLKSQKPRHSEHSEEYPPIYPDTNVKI